jgi:hypothetical protein
MSENTVLRHFETTSWRSELRLGDDLLATSSYPDPAVKT